MQTQCARFPVAELGLRCSVSDRCRYPALGHGRMRGEGDTTLPASFVQAEGRTPNPVPGTRYRAPLHHPHTSNLNRALHLSFGATLCQLFLRKGRWAEKYRINRNILRHGNCLRGCGIVGDFRGAPGGTRTPDPEIRNLVLYPTELQAPRLYPSAPMLCSHRRVS